MPIEVQTSGGWAREEVPVLSPGQYQGFRIRNFFNWLDPVTQNNGGNMLQYIQEVLTLFLWLITMIYQGSRLFGHTDTSLFCSKIIKNFLEVASDNCQGSDPDSLHRFCESAFEDLGFGSALFSEVGFGFPKGLIRSTALVVRIIKKNRYFQRLRMYSGILMCPLTFYRISFKKKCKST